MRTEAWPSGPLDAYVAADGDFRWSLSGRRPLPDGGSEELLELHSQLWQGGSWRHRLWCVWPAAPLVATTALLHITGSGDRSEDVRRAAAMARRLHAPCAVLADVPNQPLCGGLREDDLIAHTFAAFLGSGNPAQPLLCPMTRAAVRALDALQARAAQAGHARPDGCVVTGASKRGWTAWLTAAVDRRVRAVVPAVYDNLDIPRQLRRQREVFPGGYSPQIEPYVALDLPRAMEGPEGAALLRLVDPFAYRGRLSLPKWLLLGTNDPYWPVDACSLYSADLPPPTYITYVPNAGHGLAGGEGRIAAALAGAFALAAGADPLAGPPAPTWQRLAPGRVRITAPGARAARLWRATAAGLDFREATWEATALPGPGPSWEAGVEAGPGRHQAFFLEVEVPFGPTGDTAYLDTPAVVVTAGA